jgi:PAS domain S-box-containing protein
MNRQKLLQALSAIDRYAAAVLAVMCTLAIRLVFDPMLGDRAPYLFFLLMIVIVKRLWGRGPALFATLVGGIATWYFIIEPRFSFAIANRIDAFNLAAYFAVGAGVSFLGEVSSRLPAAVSVGGRNIRPHVIRQTAVLAGAAVVLAGMVLLLLRDFRRTQAAEGWVVHTYRVINSAELVLSMMKDAETGERGFLLTGDESYLAPYNSAIAVLPRGLKELKDLTSDNPSQQARLVEINRLTDERLSVLKHAIELGTASKDNAALALVRYGKGEPSMDKLRSMLDAIRGEERHLLAERTAEAAAENSRGRWVLGLGSAALVLLLVFASVVIERETVRREEITQALRRHAELLEQAHDSLITWPLGGAINYWSRGAETLFGYTREEALGRSSHELLHTHHPLGMARIDALLERDGEWKGELTQTTKDGRKLIVEGQWTVAVDARGNKTVLEANRDITERKRAVKELLESEERFRALMTASSDAVYRMSADWKEMRQLRGRNFINDTEEPNRNWLQEYIHPDDQSRMMVVINEAIRTKSIFELEHRVLRVDGTLGWTFSRAIPLLDASGEIVEWFGAASDITARKRAEAQNLLLATAIEQAAETVVITDRDATIQYINPAFTRTTGYTRGEALGQNPRILKSGQHDAKFYEELWATLNAGKLWAGEFTNRRKDGSLYVEEATIAPVRNASGEITNYIAIKFEITERKRAEEALRASEARLRTLGDNLPEGAIYRFCQDGNGNQYIDFISAGIERLTGVPAAEVTHDVGAAFRTIPPEDFERMKAATALSHERLTRFEVEVRHIHRTTGELRWSLMRSSPSRHPDGSTVWDGIEFDITGMKRIEESLRETESRERARAAEFEALMEAAPVAIFRSDDPECRWMSGNRAAHDLLRRPRGSNLSKSGPEGEKPVNFRAMKDGKEIPLSELPMQKAAATGQAVRDSEMDFVFEDGVTVKVLGDAVPLLDESGRPRGAIGTFADITERKRVEKALEESELHYRQLFERSESALGLYEMVFDAQGNSRDFLFIEVNPAWERITGLKRSQVVGHSALEITPGLEEYWMTLFSRVAATGEPATFEQYTQPLGRYYAGTAYSPRPNQVAVTFMDVTERRRAEEAVRLLNVELEQRVRRRTAALEAANHELEAFAHSVSHDLRAPLRGIDGWSLALLEDYGGSLDAQGHKYLERVRSEAQRMGMLIDDLLNLSRVGRVEIVSRTVDLTSLAETIIARLKEAHPGRSIEFIVAPQLKCTGDAQLLEVALANLFENAVKFTGPRTAGRVEFGETEFEGNPAYFVRDNGVGFDMAYAKMLFAPFQRLHKTREFPGTGIGLATVQRVIHRHGGRIWAEARVGAGATLYFTLGADKS